MKRLAFVVVVIAINLLPTRSHAQQPQVTTGLDLLNKCQPAVDMASKDLTHFEGLEAASCMGYILGMKDMLTMWHIHSRGFGEEGQIQMCVPNEATVAELVRVVVKFLNDNPTELHEQEAAVVVSAFVSAYPCKAPTH